MNLTSKKVVVDSRLLNFFCAAMFIVIPVLIGFVLQDFKVQTNLILTSDAERNTVALSQQKASAIKVQMNQAFQWLDILALLSSDRNEDGFLVVRQLDQLPAISNGFETIEFFEKEDLVRDFADISADRVSADPFERALKGEPVLAGRSAGKLGFFVPVRNQDQEVAGVLSGVMPVEALFGALETSPSGWPYFPSIIEKSGNYLINADMAEGGLADENFWDQYRSAVFESGFSLEQMQLAMDTHTSGFVPFEMNHEAWYFSFEPLDIEDYYIVFIIPRRQAEEQIVRLDELLIVHAAKIVGLLILLAMIILLFNRFIQNRLVKANQELIYSEHRFRIAASLTAKTVFSYNITQRTISMVDINGKSQVTNLSDAHFSRKLLNVDQISEEENNKIRQLFKDIESGSEVGCAIVRGKTPGDEFHWYKIRLTSGYDTKGIPIFAVGTIEDITSQKKYEDDLLAEVEQDSMTGLLNRKAAISRIDKMLERSADLPDGMFHAMMVIDIDEFKRVNDTLGHVSGDALIVKVATILQQTFRKTDIICRLGGDEFLIFLPNMNSTAMVEKKADEVLSCLSTKAEKDGKSVKISCTIGLAFYPHDGDNFLDLYQKADIALYYAKGSGKNRYAIYQSDYEA